ncbi:MAG: 16S rRNA (guanine(966)-N(2))-methyltransferase RsmD [Lentisphaerae bacterium GWF2_44_16]|nr:MAG: 16S rRNA (guanine(966)-N(2))-methyltransferase RsmD [Lentisphaerae bacterium GWF2_44_16]
MQIISGIARGLFLSTPKGYDLRPTAVRARKALFDSIREFQELNVIDLFAGSGALGLEAASRGASSVTFIDNSRQHCKIIQENIEKLKKSGVDADMKLICGDASNPSFCTRNTQAPDLIFADPPYADSPSYFDRFMRKTENPGYFSGTLLIWELPDSKRDIKHFQSIAPWRIEKKRAFGSTEFLYLKII